MTTTSNVEDATEKLAVTIPWWKWWETWPRRKRYLGLAAGAVSLSLIALATGLAIHLIPPLNLPDLIQIAPNIGPAVDSNFADPCYISDDDRHYAFATNKDKTNKPGQVHIQVSISSDFNAWNLTSYDALPHAGNWSTNAFVWSPDVVKLDNGTFVMYYTAQKAGLHCIGAAFSDKVEGPYAAQEQTQPLICPLRQGGVLDPEGFRDADGRRYLIYKVDGNIFNKPHRRFHSTPLMLQQVAADGVTLIGAPVQLLDREWADGPLIEAPTMGRYATRDGRPLYILFFSTHLFTGPGYNIKYAVADNVKGPFTRGPKPLLKTGAGPNGQLIGPGGMDVGVSSHQVVFHSIKNGTMKSGSHLIRNMWTGTLTINDEVLSI